MRGKNHRQRLKSKHPKADALERKMKKFVSHKSWKGPAQSINCEDVYIWTVYAYVKCSTRATGWFAWPHTYMQVHLWTTKHLRAAVIGKIHASLAAPEINDASYINRYLAWSVCKSITSVGGALSNLLVLFGVPGLSWHHAMRSFGK